MSKQVYISADYDPDSGDRLVVAELMKWSIDRLHKVEFIDMANPASGSVARSSDCRPCELKAEFNKQINASSAVIFVVGNMTGLRRAGSQCARTELDYNQSMCTPFKQNANGQKPCKVPRTFPTGADDDLGNINNFSYLQHEFLQAQRRKKEIIIVYNSTRKEENWLPSYMRGYENIAKPFWTYDLYGRKVGDYFYIKEALGF